MRFNRPVNDFARMPRTNPTPPIDLARSLALAAYAARRPSHSQRSIARIARLSNSTVARIDRWCAAGAPVEESYRPPTLYAYAHAIAALECAADDLRSKLDTIARDWPRS